MYDDYLSHHGIKGQKWGQRNGPPYPLSRQSRFGGTEKNKKGSSGGVAPTFGVSRSNYKPKGIRARIAKRRNEKIDKKFDEWKQQTANRDNAIELGKKKNEAQRSYESDKKNKEKKSQYKQANKDYKKALRSNTTYRKGVVRQEVERDLSRKYLSEAKRVEKEMLKNPSNKQLQKEYSSLMSQYERNRDKARREVEVSTARSYRIASIKRGMTMTLKAAAVTASIAVGVEAYNKFVSKGRNDIKFDTAFLNAQKVQELVKQGKNLMKFVRF